MNIKIVDKNLTELFSRTGKKIACHYHGEYAKGDKLIIQAPDCEFVKIQLDETLKESIVYVPGGILEYEIPVGRKKVMYAENAFAGEAHWISVCEASDAEIYSLRNLALNPYDVRGQKKYYPHVSANFVTRDEECFFERNAIDEVCENEGHGGFPYHSWAGGAREDLEYYIDLGREAEIEKIVFFLRADFPHDTYWKSIDVEFDGKVIKTAKLEQTKDGQEMVLPEKVRSRIVHLTNFKQAVQPLSWAALS